MDLDDHLGLPASLLLCLFACLWLCRAAGKDGGTEESSISYSGRRTDHKEDS